MSAATRPTWRARCPYGRLTLTLHYAENVETMRRLGWRVDRVA